MKYLMSLIFATATVLLLMIGMSRMVTAHPMESGTIREVPDYHHVTVNDEVIRKTYQVKQEKPEPSKVKPVKPVSAPKAKAQQKPVKATLVSPGGFTSPSFDHSGIDVTGDIGTEIGGTPGHLMPVSRIEPVYPTEARLKNLEGFVTLQFQINAMGDVSDIIVVESNPKRIFDKAAINAVRKWKFPQTTEATNAAQQVTLEFKMES